MKKTLIAATLCLLSQTAQADAVWFDCGFMGANGKQINLTTQEMTNGKVKAIMTDQKTGAVLMSNTIMRSKITNLGDSISTTTVVLPYGTIVLTEDTENLVVMGMLTLRGILNDKDPAARKMQNLIGNDSAMMVCAIE